MGDGLLGKCKECTKKDVTERYVWNFEKIQAYEKARFKTPHRKSKVAIYQKTRRERDPLKNRARYITTNAVRDGKLKKEPCEKCGNSKSQAHHEDYSKPLEVIWLCFICHRKQHGQLKRVS